MTSIVHSLEPITLVGAGHARNADIEEALGHGNRLIAADGGALSCLSAGHMPEAVIGDMDSFDRVAGAGIPAERIHHIDEQDSTDFDKALRHIRAPLVIGVGFTGARIDHELACMNTLVRRPDRRCILLGPDDLVFLCPPALSLDLAAGTRVSLFPLGLVEAASEGLRWAVSGIPFTPDGRIGTSNEALGEISLTTTAPKMLVILPRDCLGRVVAALAAQPSSWPARAAPHKAPRRS